MKPQEPATAASRNGESQINTVHLPAPTAWPILLALGLTLLFASLVTNMAIGALGLADSCRIRCWMVP